jgi:ATP-binding cassette, subfamily B, bacterial PglK
LARALYHRPSLLLLDEATGALDMATEAKLLEALRALAGKLTMIVAAHRLSAVANCDQLVDLGEMMTAAVKASYGVH